MSNFLSRNIAAALTLIVGLAWASGIAAQTITGAGATFPYPIYAKWAEAYKAKTGVAVNYQSIGSGGGIKQIKAKTVDFGASDKPLTLEELNRDGLTQFPAVIGGVVPVINVAGITPGQIKLTGTLLADIYLGKIKRWNHPSIAALNPGIKLPDRGITVIHRSDGSGTTFIFSHYLSKVSPEWKSKVGAESSVSWPTGVGGKGNEGVASYVQKIKASIGYVEYAYAKQNRMTFTLLQNREGTFVSPDDSSFQSAAASAHWDKSPGFYEILTDEPGKTSWPITGASFIIIPRIQANPAKAKEVLKFFRWAFTEGSKLATDLDYVPLPDNLSKLVEMSWKNQIKSSDGKPVW